MQHASEKVKNREAMEASREVSDRVAKRFSEDTVKEAARGTSYFEAARSAFQETNRNDDISKKKQFLEYKLTRLVLMKMLMEARPAFTAFREAAKKQEALENMSRDARIVGNSFTPGKLTSGEKRRLKEKVERHAKTYQQLSSEIDGLKSRLAGEFIRAEREGVINKEVAQSLVEQIDPGDKSGEILPAGGPRIGIETVKAVNAMIQRWDAEVDADLETIKEIERIGFEVFDEAALEESRIVEQAFGEHGIAPKKMKIDDFLMSWENFRKSLARKAEQGYQRAEGIGPKYGMSREEAIEAAGKNLGLALTGYGVQENLKKQEAPKHQAPSSPSMG